MARSVLIHRTMKRSQVLHNQKMEGAHVLFFISTDNEGMKSELTGIVESKVIPANGKVETIHDLQTLKERLCRLAKGIEVAVLVAATKDQIGDLVELKDFLGGIQVILIVPDQDKETISRAARLLPSFISPLDVDLRFVGDVLERMIRHRA